MTKIASMIAPTNALRLPWITARKIPAPGRWRVGALVVVSVVAETVLIVPSVLSLRSARADRGSR